MGGPLILRSLMMTLAITGAPDSHRGPVFLAGADGQRGLDCPDVLFVGSRTDFVTSVRVLTASDGVLALRGPNWGPNTPGGIPSAPPPLATSPAMADLLSMEYLLKPPTASETTAVVESSLADTTNKLMRFPKR